MLCWCWWWNCLKATKNQSLLMTNTELVFNWYACNAILVISVCPGWWWGHSCSWSTPWPLISLSACCLRSALPWSLWLCVLATVNCSPLPAGTDGPSSGREISSLEKCLKSRMFGTNKFLKLALNIQWRVLNIVYCVQEKLGWKFVKLVLLNHCLFILPNHLLPEVDPLMMKVCLHLRFCFEVHVVLK